MDSEPPTRTGDQLLKPPLTLRERGAGKMDGAIRHSKARRWMYCQPEGGYPQSEHRSDDRGTVPALPSVLAVLVACITTTTFTAALIRVLPRLGIMDAPNSRSSHASPTPRGGGIAVLTGLTAGVLVRPDPGLAIAVVIAWCAGALGLVDDVRGLSAKSRLAVQLLIAIPASIITLHVHGGMAFRVAILMGVVWVAFVNACNFMDGINALSAITGIVAGGWYLSQEPHQLLGALLIASCVGFLVFNARGRIFLGDVGSYALGSIVWSLAAVHLVTNERFVDAMAPMSLYAVETSVAIIALFLAGESIGQPHRRHAYQQLVDTGMRHMAVALLSGGVLILMLVPIWGLRNWLTGATVAASVGLCYVGFAYCRNRGSMNAVSA